MRVCALASARIARSRAGAQAGRDNITPVYEGWLPQRRRLVRSRVRLPESRVGRGSRPSRSAPTTRWSRAARISASPRTSSRAATASSSRCACRRTSARRRSSGRSPARAGPRRRTARSSPTTCSTTPSIMSNIGAGGALSTTPDMVGNKAPVLTRRRPHEPDREGRRAAARSPRSPPTMASRTSGTCRRRSGGNYMLPQTANGLRLSFFVYRGAGKAVTFDPPQTKVWEDTRDGGGSPWSAGWVVPPIPEGNIWQARATFARARHLCHPRARPRRRIVLLAGCDDRRHEMSSRN